MSAYKMSKIGLVCLPLLFLLGVAFYAPEWRWLAQIACVFILMLIPLIKFINHRIKVETKNGVKPTQPGWQEYAAILAFVAVLVGVVYVSTEKALKEYVESDQYVGSSF